MNIEERKSQIIDWLSKTNDLAIIFQIENLLKPDKVDFWEELSDKEKASILKGIEDVETGNKMLYHKNLFRKKETALTTEQKQALDKRFASYKNGTAKTVSWEEVEAKLIEKYGLQP